MGTWGSREAAPWFGGILFSFVSFFLFLSRLGRGKKVVVVLAFGT